MSKIDELGGRKIIFNNQFSTTNAQVERSCIINRLIIKAAGWKVIELSTFKYYLLHMAYSII